MNARSSASRFGAVVIVLILVTCLAVGGIAWDRWWRHAGATNAGSTCPTVIHAKRRLPLAAFGVHRVALIGDSIMWQPSCTIAESLANIGIETSRHAVSGTGLLNGSVDWIAETQSILHAEHPDIVIAIFVGNYPPPPILDKNGSVVADDSPAFFAAWQQRAVTLSNDVRAAGARMYWVSPPPIALPPLGHAQRLYDGYRTIHGDHFLDSGDALADSRGSGVWAKNTCGRKRLVRSPLDGVHLTDDGARIYGQQISHDLTAQLGILATPLPC